ncbi:MAG: serine/threonine-protein kinase [Prevotellaceae bacterium]|nr:serine/threonine-protein kinase [Prevotellaceae bacterium]
MLEIGSLVDGKYKILNKIGQGGMSVVYMALNEKANKTWAVKEVRKDGVLDFESVRQGLVAETDILKKLSHPNLPSIVDVIDTEDSFIIIMDYIQGNDLQNTLDEFGAQPQEMVIEWAKQLCDVFGYLHSRTPAIIYRDMKPKNVMLKPDGNVALIDFGTAREFKEKNLADTTCLGTVGYAAPEQFGGMGQTDARTDIYCLGATLYHLVTGCNPSEPPYEMKPIREINPALSSGLERIILKCTQRNPDDRYQSAAELMYALDHYEEIDDLYKKKQKKKLALFLTTAILTICFAVGGFFLNLTASKMATNTYDIKIDDAAKSAEYSTKVGLYEECIAIPNMAGRKDAYLGLIKTYKENDSVFSVEEAQQLEKLIKGNKSAIKEDPESYTEICFETGKLFWYYYNYGNGSNNQITNAKSSIERFQDVINNAPAGYENLGMAKAYANIGTFYRDITTDVKEASDKGKYKPLFENLTDLIDTVASDEKESEIVRLELIELTRSAIQQYSTKFKIDGVTHDELNALYGKIEKLLSSISVPTNDNTDVRTVKKANTMKYMEDTQKAIDIAFGTDKGGN